MPGIHVGSLSPLTAILPSDSFNPVLATGIGRNKFKMPFPNLTLCSVPRSHNNQPTSIPLKLTPNRILISHRVIPIPDPVYKIM
ncbi:hypothetical protein QSE00_06190 [Arenibacter sp. M-2]|nr:hypothetical protein [Arenibacter sp. M-2]